jgi:hypothetical protein
LVGVLDLQARSNIHFQHHRRQFTGERNIDAQIAEWERPGGGAGNLQNPVPGGDL